MMMVVMLVLILVLIVIVMMVTSAIGIVTLVVTVVMMVVVLCLMLQALELLLDRITSLHCRQKLLAVKLCPRRGDNGSCCVMLTQKCNRLVQLVLLYVIGVRKHDAACVFDLIVEELAEVFHIHLAFLDVNDRCKAIEHRCILGYALYRADDVGKLADSGGLNENTVGMIGIEHLMQSLTEITDKRAANATAVHFSHFDSRILHKAAVDADLAEFIFNQNQLLSCISLFQKLFDQRCFTCAEKAGKNINLCHVHLPSFFQNHLIL